MKGFELSDKNGFRCGVFVSVNHISARVSILKLLKADLILNDIHIMLY
ncbi:MAG: hypothetical protein LBN19_04895 [Endomicrobium sp.]|nr:hypothetical protein [Endomicrobium sp.]